MPATPPVDLKKENQPDGKKHKARVNNIDSAVTKHAQAETVTNTASSMDQPALAPKHSACLTKSMAPNYMPQLHVNKGKTGKSNAKNRQKGTN
ncbi:hypothetical protein Moror_15429 [Moniliophthora roreri MCA 2997]|uniref:Uncharacterized protein n=1 Tax=Moniliophthora roreri (strain MCA 2997) TaxID=1381753 RepID=V2WKW5_MONRO|nr:hypothetical protein Moror_15429 [Moniliophthora roreri MCA 2997]